MGGANVRSRVYGGLRYFESEAEEGAADVVRAAREVLNVIKDVLSRGPVLPFRYPTLLEDESEVAKLAAERGKEFAQFLERVGTQVQMDVRLMRQKSKGPLTARSDSGTPALGMTEAVGASPAPTNFGNQTPQFDTTSKVGREYLLDKARWKTLLEAASQRCRNLAGARDWRVEERDGQLVCHALIGRDEVISFQERMRRLDLPGGVEAVVSGPWPPAGFWEDKSH